MQVRVVKMRNKGVEHDRRAMRDLLGHRGILVIMDVSDQGLRRPAKVARLMQGADIRHELTDVHIIWCNDGRFVLAGFERNVNEAASQSTMPSRGCARWMSTSCRICRCRKFATCGRNNKDGQLKTAFDPKRTPPRRSCLDIVHRLAYLYVTENAIPALGLFTWDMYSNQLCENGCSLFDAIDSDLNPLDKLVAICTEVVEPITIPFREVSVLYIPRAPTRRQVVQFVHGSS
jgi:hypothetical protein